MKKTVAIFPSGSEIGLEINSALKYSTHFKTIGFSGIHSHADYVMENCIDTVPMIGSEDFFDRFNSLIRENKIDYIYPALDDVQLFLMRNVDKIAAKIVSAEPDTVEICRSKSRTYEKLKDCDFVPRTYTLNSIEHYPVFMKPDIGCGSQGVVLASDKRTAEFALSQNPGMVICEYLPGEEYTVDCFTDASGRLAVSKMRNRKRIRNGISVSSESLPEDVRVREIAEIINSKIKFFGAWFFQLKKNTSGHYKLLEIAPRIAGTMGLTRNLGINLPLLTLFLFEGKNVGIIDNDYRAEVDRALISRYSTDIKYDTVYLDFDDTLIVNGKTNLEIVMFLYQCVNNGKKIILLTKHTKDLYATLAEHRISATLFDEIIWITPDKAKCDYIDANNAVFIDDSFSERQAVSNKLSVPVFDCSEIECLLDWRVPQ